MDLVNDLSSEVALAVFVDGSLRHRLDAKDAKSLIALVEAELTRIAASVEDPKERFTMSTDLSH